MASQFLEGIPTHRTPRMGCDLGLGAVFLAEGLLPELFCVTRPHGAKGEAVLSLVGSYENFTIRVHM